jgi:hypothetical protein
MTNRYSDYIKTGEMSQMDAIKHQSVRDGAKAGMMATLAHHAKQGLPADAAAFGALDIIAVNLVKWYGPDAAATVLRHYADVCARQADPRDTTANLPFEGGAE